MFKFGFIAGDAAGVEAETEQACGDAPPPPAVEVTAAQARGGTAGAPSLLLTWGVSESSTVGVQDSQGLADQEMVELSAWVTLIKVRPAHRRGRHLQLEALGPTCSLERLGAAGIGGASQGSCIARPSVRGRQRPHSRAV